jgi:tetratricopeptide (TPR) repeat protein
MNRLLILAIATVTMAGCAEIQDLANRGENSYEKAPFYAKYLNTGSDLDREMQRVLADLRANPASPELHNDLGALLVQKGFSKDAEREFERAVHADKRYFPGWYNLGLVRASLGDNIGARRAFYETIDVKPGHSAALFQLGLIEEKRGRREKALAFYSKAYLINPALLDVKVNPRVLDSSLTDLALLRLYHMQHDRKTMLFQGARQLNPVSNGLARNRVPEPAEQSTQQVETETPPIPESASPQPAARSIIVPAAPVTDPGAQSTTATTTAEEPRRGRRRPRPQPEEGQQQPFDPNNPSPQNVPADPNAQPVFNPQAPPPPPPTNPQVPPPDSSAH